MSDAAVHVFGIRHHGPGSARSVGAALDALAPDVVLIEGPSDAGDDVIALAAQEGMQPPVALLQYVPDEPHRAVYYPFAVFSPEWVALRHALGRKVPVQFIDLPSSHQLAIDAEEKSAAEADANAEADSDAETDGDAAAVADADADADADVDAETKDVAPSLDVRIRRDPLQAVAEAAGYADGERWWEHVVEERQDHTGVFEAVFEVMTALREGLDNGAGGDARDAREQLREEQREAWMRQAIRQAKRDGHERIAVICGAWHAPALVAEVAVKADAETLKGMPKVKIRSTWIPWSPARLARESGYGAGVASPGWYAHLWEHGATPDSAIHWMTRVGRVLRDEGIDASPAQTIDAVRLASTLAALRGRAVPGLPELSESALSAFLNGDSTPLALIRSRLVIGDALGTVPDGTPMVPLQESLARDQKRLRLAPQASEKLLELDLRQAFDRERSVLLHRLSLLGVDWGRAERSTGAGTFKEVWRIVWAPELAVAVIEAAIWGNTVADAAVARAGHLANEAPDLPAIAALLGRLLVADVPQAARLAIARLDALAAVSGDFAQLCAALPPVARTLRYGDVRGTDRGLLAHVVAGMVARISAGLPAACGSLDDDAAAAMFAHVVAVNEALTRSSDAALLTSWREALRRVLALGNVHGLVAGRVARLLLDASEITTDDAGRHWSAALSRGSDPAIGAAWVEGFLRDSGTVLVHDAALWAILDGWLSGLSSDAFSAVLPLLRRTVATFSAPERRRLGERARSGTGVVSVVSMKEDAMSFNAERAAAVLPTIARLLGIEGPAGGGA
ncbi:MAG TPA: DUF5682 family protein [Gemmatimonadaceae bacterium]|nr:DUF5682 family protein [Gemmatimonadaceae bacterium]